MKTLQSAISYILNLNDGIYALLCIVILLPISTFLSYQLFGNLSSNNATLIALLLGVLILAIIALAIFLYAFAGIFINLKFLITIFSVIFGILLILQIVATGGHTIYDGVPY